MAVDLSMLDLLFQLVPESTSTHHSSSSSWKSFVNAVALHTAVLMDPKQTSNPGDAVGSFVGHIESVFSSLDLQEIEEQDLIERIVYVNDDLENMVEQCRKGKGVEDAVRNYQVICSCWAHPSNVNFPRTNQLGFIYHLLKNLEQLLTKAKAESIGPLKYYILQLQQKLHLLSGVLLEIPESDKKECDELLLRITDLAYQAEYVIDSFLITDIPIWFCMHWLIRILERLEKIVNMESGLVQIISNSKARRTELVNMAPLDAVFKFVHESHFTPPSPLEEGLFMLALCIAVVMDPPKLLLVEDTSLEEIAIHLGRIGSMVSSLDINKTDHQYLCDHIASVLSTSGVVNLLKQLPEQPPTLLSEIEDSRCLIHDQILLANLPDDLYYLINRIDHLMEYNANSMGLLKYYALQIQQKLHLFRYALKENPELSKWKEGVTDLYPIAEIMRYAQMLEYIIRSFLTGDVPMWLCLFALQTLFRGLENEMRQLKIISGLRGYTMEDHTATSKSKKPNIVDGVIGFKAEAERMLQLLTGGTKRLCLISIVAMAGQGKTTLAKKLYEHPSVVRYFDTLSQCCVTQEYRRRELLLELLREASQHCDNIHRKDDQELAEMLYKALKGQRFIILLDDIWSIDAWNDLSRCFPDDNNGSRIMFTSRIRGLAFQVKSDIIMQPLHPLSHEESWELLKNKVFQKESCPVELLGIGRQIAEDCRGLPLSVVLVGGLLAKLERKVDVWEDIADSLTSQILSSDAEAHGKATIQLSYKHLSDSLKPCFLFCGAFMEDKEIHVQKLVRLWIAEGFIKGTHLKSLEDMAMDHLMELVNRSLVTVVREKSTGEVKSCRVHDLLREFCLATSKKESFLIHINGYDEPFLSSIPSLDFGIDPNNSCPSTPIISDLYRLSIHSKRNHLVMLKPSGQFTRSLLFSARSDMCPHYAYDISFIFYNLKFLKILDLEEINIGDSFKKIDVLTLLRYLAVQSDVDFIPSSIVNLSNLETFVFKGLSTSAIEVPDSFWDMENLRHVHVNGCVSFHLELTRLEKCSTIDNLQSFSTPSLTHGDDMLKMLKKCPSIQELKCIFLDSWDEAKGSNHFPELDFLNKLVSLKVVYNGKGLYPCEFSFPSNLKKLSLSNFRMPWSEISQLAALNNLEVLKLLDNAFEGETWTLHAEDFPKLKFLKLKTLNVKEWEMEDEVFPSLEHLSLHNCQQLVEIPPIIGDINTLLKIEVVWCNSSLAASVENIRDFQLEEYDKEIKIHIQLQECEIPDPLHDD